MLVDKNSGQIHKIRSTVVEAYQAVDNYPKGSVAIYAVTVEILDESSFLGEIITEVPTK